MPQELTQERLKELLSYDPETGAFVWLQKRGNRSIGSLAGERRADGYLIISIDDKSYLSGRLAWFYVKGIWPTEIDHIDRNPSNDRLFNLRDATRSQNAANRADPRTKRFRGVRQFGQKWNARIGVMGTERHLGMFDTAQEAAAAYNKASIEIFGEFALLNEIEIS